MQIYFFVGKGSSLNTAKTYHRHILAGSRPHLATPPRHHALVQDRPWAFGIVPPGDGDVPFDAEVTMVVGGAFAFVTGDDHLHLCILVRRQDNLLQAVKWLTRCFRPCVGLDVRARYLVVSGGELLMVVSFMPHPDPQLASKFKVFRVI